MAPITEPGEKLLVERDLLKAEINNMFLKLSERKDLTLQYYMSFKEEINGFKNEWLIKNRKLNKYQ